MCAGVRWVVCARGNVRWCALGGVRWAGVRWLIALVWLD